MGKIKGITCDSRKVKPGYIFVAIKGIHQDGNNYINDAINNGAKLIVTDKKHKAAQKTRVPTLLVDNSRIYLAKLTADFYKNPSHNLKVIGVTGTNGKTTTTHLIYNLLNHRKKQTGIIGTVKVDTGEKTKKGNLTTPDTEKLQKFFSDMKNNNIKYCSMEVSSHGIKLKRTESTKFSFKIGTNITSDHLDLHQDIRDYINVKKNFLKDKSNIPVLINQDDTVFSSIGKLAKNQINYSINKNTIIKAENIKYKNNKTKFDYSIKKTISGPESKIKPLQFTITINLIGKHNIYNTLPAITAGLYYGLTPKSIQDFFADYRGIWRRFEIIYNKKFMVIDDCAHNPGSYQAVFATVKKMNYRKLFIINAIRGNRGVEINKENAKKIAIETRNIKNSQLIITKCKNTVKADDIVKTEEKQSFLNKLSNYNRKYKYFDSLVDSIDYSLSKVKEEDIILLLGAHAMDQAGKLILQMINKNIYV